MELTFNKVVGINIFLLIIGLVLLYFSFPNKDTEVQKPVQIEISQFDDYFELSGFHDSILVKHNLIAFYRVYNDTLPTRSVNNILDSLRNAKLIKVPQNLDTLDIPINNLKAKCDSYALSEIAKTKSSFKHITYFSLLLLMTIVGMLGGVLANLRGFYEFSTPDKEFPAYLYKPYLIRPFTGLLVGLLVYFLSAAIGTKLVSADSHLVNFESMVGFLALAIVAGFASQAFTERLLLAVNVLFGGDFEVERVEIPDSGEDQNEIKIKKENESEAQKEITKKLDVLQSAQPTDPDNTTTKKEIVEMVNTIQKRPLRKTASTFVRLKNRS